MRSFLSVVMLATCLFLSACGGKDTSAVNTDRRIPILNPGGDHFKDDIDFMIQYQEYQEYRKEKVTEYEKSYEKKRSKFQASQNEYLSSDDTINTDSPIIDIDKIQDINLFPSAQEISSTSSGWDGDSNKYITLTEIDRMYFCCMQKTPITKEDVLENLSALDENHDDSFFDYLKGSL
ncbi:MAG: hypothetical protein P857_249 [Candidatus Xenolissoclinum pacificiensis L6]|uniref:Lipoprotein n=1 Tax=Candidatus Xenolissoclinum pacificiensis L6 TaxID=1401685 RepID=W2V1M6_9RICK|nr:MAG: hypothetical protein P857_249 [Candidatus Xenolissoclinum pacificiensis L6]